MRAADKHDTLRFIRCDEVLKRTGKTRALMYEEMARGKFPKPVPISARACAWIESEVVAWMNARIRERDMRPRSLPNPARSTKPKRASIQRRCYKLRKVSLSAAQVAQLRKQPGTHRVSNNLYLRVKPERTASWLFRFVIQSKASWMGLGSYDTFSLKEARVRAHNAQQLLANGIDPLENKRAQRLEAAKCTAQVQRQANGANQHARL